MTTATTQTWNPTFVQVATAALLLVSAIDETETPSADELASCQMSANALIKEWQALGLHVWTEEEAILFLQPGQIRYLLGGSTTDHCCDAYNYVQTTLTSNANTGATSIPVAATTGISNGDNIGILLATNAIFWTTVSGAPSGLNVTLAAPLPSAANSGGYVFDYPAGTDITRPLAIPNARAMMYSGPNLTPMRMLSRQEYQDLPNPLTDGSPTMAHYWPALEQGQFFQWNNLNSAATWGIRFSWYRSLYDILTNAQTFDFPQEWVNALIWNIAREQMVSYDVPPQRAQMINAGALEKREIVQGYDREMTPIHFGLDVRPR